MAGFSRSQQAFHFRPIVAEAWAAHCRENGVDPKAKVLRDHWYRQQLHECLGVWTTKQCNASRDFERAMAHFEILAGNGIKWQLRLEGGTARRILAKIREVCREYDIPEDYARGLARQALKRDTLPDLERLTPADLLAILKIIRAQGNRIGAAAGGDNPF